MSRIDKSYSYRALQAIHTLQPPEVRDGGVTSDAVSMYTGIGKHRAATICGQIASHGWIGGQPWLQVISVAPKHYRTTKEGDDALEDATHSTSLIEDEGTWADKVRWPSEERYSRLVNVAIPSGGPARGWSVWAKTQHFLEHGKEYDEDDARALMRELLG